MSPAKRGRPAGDAENKILEATTRLIVRQGFAATTVDDICAEAKVSKGAFFHYFASKEEMAIAALDSFFEKRTQALTNYLDSHTQTPEARVFGHFDFASTPEATKFKGCLIGVLALETSRTHPKIRKKCDDMFAAWAEQIAADLRAALPHVDPQALGQFAAGFVAMLEGAIMLAKSSNSPERIKEMLNHLRTVFEHLLSGRIQQ